MNKECKFREGEIVKQVTCVNSSQNSICKIVRIEEMLTHTIIHHKHKTSKGWDFVSRTARAADFVKLPKLKQELYK